MYENSLLTEEYNKKRKLNENLLLSELLIIFKSLSTIKTIILEYCNSQRSKAWLLTKKNEKKVVDEYSNSYVNFLFSEADYSNQLSFQLDIHINEILKEICKCFNLSMTEFIATKNIDFYSEANRNVDLLPYLKQQLSMMQNGKNDISVLKICDLLQQCGDDSPNLDIIVNGNKRDNKEYFIQKKNS